MPLYQEFYGISYVLRTMDIDFAVQLLKGKKSFRIDFPGIITSHGFTSFFTRSGSKHSLKVLQQIPTDVDGLLRQVPRGQGTGEVKDDENPMVPRFL